ncbi:MAG: sulfatase-like hydrolase/transferase [Methanomicrobiales archaeon]|nr:sulfatase-like hydrolase/transferase [Methanomicrobiales archaeon]
MNRISLVIIFFSCIGISIVTGDTDQQNVILISWDGISRDTLEYLIDSGNLEHLSGILENGSFVNISITDHFPDTLSGHAQILTGYSPEISGVFKSMRYKEIPEGYTVFERLKEFAGDDGISTVIIASQERSLGPLKGLPFYHAGKVVDYYYDQNSDAGLLGTVVSEALYHFAQKGRFFMFVHFRDAADAGYAFGAGTKKQEDSIQSIDASLGEILKTIQKAGIMEKTAIYITTDHGFNTGQKDYTGQANLWLVANEPGLNMNGDQKDIALTILKKFQVPYENITPHYPGEPLI